MSPSKRGRSSSSPRWQARLPPSSRAATQISRSSPVDEEAVDRAPQRLDAPRHVREEEQPMGKRLAGPPELQLLPGQRAPERVDDLGRVVIEICSRALEVLAPELQPGRLRERLIVVDD